MGARRIAGQEILGARPCSRFVAHRVQSFDGEQLALLNQQPARVVSPQTFERCESGAGVVVSEERPRSRQTATFGARGLRRRKDFGKRADRRCLTWWRIS